MTVSAGIAFSGDSAGGHTSCIAESSAYRSRVGMVCSLKLGQDMRYASAEIKGSCFEPKICLGDVMKSSKVAKLNGRKVWSISSK
jgi:hypothetical protein